MRVTTEKYYKAYLEQLEESITTLLHTIDFSDKQVDLGYRIKASAVYSANIEGNSIDLNSYMNSITTKVNFKPEKEMSEIQDLINAYKWAADKPVTEPNLLAIHKILSQTILRESKRGIYRNDRMGVFGSSGLIYLAIEPHYVAEKMAELISDIQILLTRDLPLEKVFYHASLIHLKFVHIHPFWDGNGRTARLLEKWFLSKKMNGRAWKIQSEKYYKEHLQTYYRAINLGVNYYELNYERCLPFLELLPRSLAYDVQK